MVVLELVPFGVHQICYHWQISFLKNFESHYFASTLVSVDCIDCAADESIVNAVGEGIEVAREITRTKRPWVMISVNDDQDLHFRKAGDYLLNMK